MDVLENHAPDIYMAMLESDSLEVHFMSVRDMAEKYVENCVACYTNSDEYLNAENNDHAEIMHMLNMTIL